MRSRHCTVLAICPSQASPTFLATATQIFQNHTAFHSDTGAAASYIASGPSTTDPVQPSACQSMPPCSTTGAARLASHAALPRPEATLESIFGPPKVTGLPCTSHSRGTMILFVCSTQLGPPFAMLIVGQTHTFGAQRWAGQTLQ
jgi:hypothetical protein